MTILIFLEHVLYLNDLQSESCKITSHGRGGASGTYLVLVVFVFALMGAFTLSSRITTDFRDITLV
jgi:hypothetical protein